jgi:hypothetical protein
MKDERADGTKIGKYTGTIAETYREPAFLSWLENINELVAQATDKTAPTGRNVNVCLTFQGRTPVQIAVKSFGQESILKDWIDRDRGSKARRTWLAACFLRTRGVETPPPIAYLELRQAGCIVESYYLSEFQSGVTTFTDELVRLFREDQDCGKFMSIMRCVAEAIRKMHEAGFRHNDLGNQNILLRYTGQSLWSDVQFVDLNRGQMKERLSMVDRARDISRIYLPSDLLRVFKEMYWGDMPAPDNFQQWEHLFRRQYALHSWTRRFRHPVRTFKSREREQRRITYPSEKDMWIWDEKSAQPISTMRPKDRRRFRKSCDTLRIVAATLGAMPGVWQEYRSLLRDCYGKPVEMRNRVGISISPNPKTLDREMSLLEELGSLPVLIRFCCHETEERRNFLARLVEDLHKNGHPVSISLVQNRRAVIEPGQWALFVSAVLDRVAGHVEQVEIGHAINRVKWGIWNLDEHRRLIDGIAKIKDTYQRLSFIGPAAIDFEYPYLLAALKNIPDSLHLSALSHHLYVDRRGAPENAQGGFSALEKFALARAIARNSGVCDDKLIVSEVNWPLKGTGEYSPVTSPYESPGPRFNDPSVSESEYANYMIRYLLIAICSGMVDRVFWWRLVARGFGLVDDTDPEKWRNRSAFIMFRHFLSLLGSATFAGKLPSSEGAHLFVFTLPDKRKVCVAYSCEGDRQIGLPFECSHVTNTEGETIAGIGPSVRISGAPVYLFGK